MRRRLWSLTKASDDPSEERLQSQAKHLPHLNPAPCQQDFVEIVREFLACCRLSHGFADLVAIRAVDTPSDRQHELDSIAADCRCSRPKESVRHERLFCARRGVDGPVFG